MILRMLVKLSLLEDDGTVIKEKEYGRGYLDSIDMAKASEDWWHITCYNAKNPTNKKKYPKHCTTVSKIVDILTSQLKRTILNHFLCDRKSIEKQYASCQPDEDS